MVWLTLFASLGLIGCRFLVYKYFAPIALSNKSPLLKHRILATKGPIVYIVIDLIRLLLAIVGSNVAKKLNWDAENQTTSNNTNLIFNFVFALFINGWIYTSLVKYAEFAR
jgi:hypothetical protein